MSVPDMEEGGLCLFNTNTTDHKETRLVILTVSDLTPSTDYTVNSVCMFIWVVDVRLMMSTELLSQRS